MIGSDTIQTLRDIVAQMGREFVCENPSAFAGAILDMCDAGEVKLLFTALRSHYSAQLMDFFLKGGDDPATWTRQKAFFIDESGMSDQNVEAVLDALWQAMDWHPPKPQIAETRVAPEEVTVEKGPSTTADPGVTAFAGDREDESKYRYAEAPKKKSGGKIAAVIAILLLLAGGGIYYFRATPFGIPAVTSVVWQKDKDTFEIKWKSNGATGRWYCRYRFADDYPDNKGGFWCGTIDIGSDESEGSFCAENYEFIPGKRYAFYFTKDEAPQAGQTIPEAAKGKVPSQDGSSKISVLDLDVQDIKLSDAKQLLADLDAVHQANDGSDTMQKVQEAAEAAHLTATLTLRHFDAANWELTTMKLLLTLPSGKEAYPIVIICYGMNGVNDYSSTIADTLFFSYVLHGDLDDIETGEYKIEMYDWDSKDRIGETSFRIK